MLLRAIFFCSAYFAVSLMGTISELLDNAKHDKLQIVGCQTLTRFIYSQVYHMTPLELGSTMQIKIISE